MPDDDSIYCRSSLKYQRLFSVPLGAFIDHVVADITLGVNPKYGNTIDSDMWVVLSDGTVGIGFVVFDVDNYGDFSPCVNAVLTPGAQSSDHKVIKYGPLISQMNPYPALYNFLISTHQQSGVCLTATAMEGGYTTGGYYNATLAVGNQLTLDIYGGHAEEKFSFKYIAVDIHAGL